MPDKRPKTDPTERVLDFIREHKLIEAGELIIVGVSGGPDSICLLYILDSLKAELDINLHVAHLNHQLRGAESDADAAFVATFAARLGIPATVESRDVAAYRKARRLSIEEAAREVRYDFFAGLAEKLGAQKVAVGHTASDHVETILMHIIRGSGTRGLAGLQPEMTLRTNRAPLTVIRPILTLDRAVTEAYSKNHNLAWRIDSTNLQPETLRNRIRLELIPVLRKYNPEIEKAVIRTAAIARDDADFIDQATQQAWREIVKQSDDRITIEKNGFLALPLSLRRNLLRQTVAALAGDLRNIELTHIEGIMSIIEAGAGKKITLPGGLVFATGYREFTLRKSDTATVAPPIKGRNSLNIPGETIVPGWRIEASVFERQSMEGLYPGEDAFTAFFDFDRTGDTLFVRARKPGDRFVPLGMLQPKTVAEFLIDEKVPRAERAGIPIVESSNGIIWLAGVRIDERVKVMDVTKRMLMLNLKKTGC